MGDLLLPVSRYNGSASWQTHINRGTPSTEPGTDLYVPIGTPVYAPAAGEIWGSGLSIGPATGRWVGINFDNGMSFRCMHHSRLVRTSGRVEQGELIAYSGASGYGEEDWSWNVAGTGGAHTHITLWPTWDRRYGYKSNGQPYTIDFMKYVGGSAAGSATAFDPEGFLMALSDYDQQLVKNAVVDINNRTADMAAAMKDSDAQVAALHALYAERDVNGWAWADVVKSHVVATLQELRSSGLVAEHVDLDALTKRIVDEQARRLAS